MYKRLWTNNYALLFFFFEKILKCIERNEVNMNFQKNLQKGTLEVYNPDTKVSKWISELFEVKEIIIPINSNPCPDTKYAINGLVSQHIQSEFEITTSQFIDASEFKRIMYNHTFSFPLNKVDLIRSYLQTELFSCKEERSICL